MRSSRRRAAGLTLVEVSVALALLSLVLAGVFTCLVTAQRAAAAAREEQAASDAAMRQLDLLMSIPSFDALVATPSVAFPVAVNTGMGEVPLRPASAAFFDPRGDDPTMSGHARVVQNPDGEDPPSSDLVEVQVTVAWRASDARDRRLDVVTRRAR